MKLTLKDWHFIYKQLEQARTYMSKSAKEIIIQIIVRPIPVVAPEAVYSQRPKLSAFVKLCLTAIGSGFFYSLVKYISST
jgi:hypothetical protein